ncbi:cupin domain-containing protein [Tateyamaria sp.]|uniref:cupin domain-containing protein n=1 Tax=Tateyamaria sp. TaxID=1929288 RepID=UPI003B21D225
MTDDTYLITADEIAAMPGLEKTHFLNQNAQRVNKSLGDVTGLTGIGFHIIEVEPGFETTEHHVHYYEEECVYVLAGTATSLIGGEEAQIGPGDFIGYRKGGLAHSIKNTGTETFRCIVVGQRLDHDVADYTHQDKRIFRNAGLPWSLVDHTDITVLGGTAGKK